ncbi:MAG: tRNA pseudouridine(55) synthase TruB [Massiliimalia sp.]|jgi:tRNA pseudouridine55 synthase
MNGIICVNKPQGWTSFDVVAKVRGIARTKKVGHAGTLDPMATGVLPLFFGNATKACDVMPNDDKGYFATFQLGLRTDTQDVTGTVLSQEETHITKEQVLEILPKFTGDLSQIPPMYSAVWVNGRRLYDLARSGQEVERQPRSITIKELELCSFDEQTQVGQVRVLCSKGTYIRTLCSDMGDSLGCGAALTQLQRYQAGNFTLEDCYTLEQLQQMADEGSLEQHVLSVAKVFEQLPKIKLNPVQSSKFRNGVRLDLNRVYHKQVAGFHKVFDNENQFMGLASLDLEKMELVIEKMFPQN